MNLVNQFIRSNTWIIILFGIGVSLVYPGFGNSLRPFLNYILMLMMFISCLDLHPDDISRTLGNPRSLSLSLLIVHLCSPLIVFFLRDYFPEPIYLGLIIATVTPAGRSAIFLSRAYGGIPERSLVLTTLSNLLSYLVVPGLVYLFAGQVFQFNPIPMANAILVTIVIPLLAAIAVSRTSLGRQINQISSNFTVGLMFLIIVGIISPLQPIIFQYLHLTILLSVIIALMSVINFALGYLIGQDHSEKITLAITSSYKNYTLSTLLSLSLFTPLVALPSVVYTLVSNLLLVPLDFFLGGNLRHQPHHRQKYRNLIMFIIGSGIAVLLAKNPYFIEFIDIIRPFTLPASFIGGIFFASTFTISLGTLILANLAATTPLFLLVVAAALGAVSCDAIVFFFFKNTITPEILPIYRKFVRHNHFGPLLHTPYFAWTLPVLGALLIASPLPDEIGISLLGLSRTSTLKFFAISVFSHIFGLTFLLLGARLL